MLAALIGFVMTLTGTVSLALNFSQQNVAPVGAAVAVASVGLAYRFGRLLFVIFFAMWEMHSARELWIVPQPLADFSVDHSSGKKFSFLGYELESPWANFEKETKYQGSGSVYLKSLLQLLGESF